VDAKGHYEAALRAIRTQRGDALEQARSAVRIDPGFVAARQLEAWLLLSSRDARDFKEAGTAYAKLSRMPMSARERLHAGAMAWAVEGDYSRAARQLDAIVLENPRDLVALATAHVFDYYLGRAEALRLRAAHALPHWSPADPEYHFLLSLYAFALEESGDYEVAEKTAVRALGLEPRDVRAHHVVTHVLEMQGRAEEGLRWMGTRSDWWSGAGTITTHLWWHIALHQLELGAERVAIEVYDRRLQGEGLSELIDAAALLWRLRVAGHDNTDRFAALSVRWEPYAEDAHCAFVDLHAMMAFAGARRWQLVERLLAAQTRRVEGPGGSNYDMTRLVGLPATKALAAYGRENYAEAEALLRALPLVAHRIGGSHAQRDILHLTHASADQRRRKAA
jgi:tetratricopeptide (TPR) repeat protein